MIYSIPAKSLILEEGDYSNYISIDGVDYSIEYLDPDNPDKSSTPNGFVFKLRDMQEERDAYVIKFCRVYKPCKNDYLSRWIRRFEREILALKKVKDENLNDHVVEIQSDGEHEVDVNAGARKLTFLYYTMELGSGDLSSFLREEIIEQPEKFKICADIMRSIERLHALGLYHRDIKPGNFLMVGNTWKIADLGLVMFREEDSSTIDTPNEKVGPFGYLSPEALNKSLGFNLDTHKIVIDDKSDVFQLAKVVGFILLGEILTGMIEPHDFVKVEDPPGDLFVLMSGAMQYAKDRRYDVRTFRTKFVESFGKQYGLS